LDLSSFIRLTSQLASLAADGLSLVLPSGRTLGHRSLKVYYAQRLRDSGLSSNNDLVSSKVALVRERLADPTQALVPVAGGHGAFGKGQQLIKARNAGEANWAKKAGRSYQDQKRRDDFRTKIGFKHNNQKRAYGILSCR
jgi:pre-60S factor REI1